MGEPVRLMIDLPNEAEPSWTCSRVPRKGGLWWRPSAGDGFVVPGSEEVMAQTRSGKQVLNLQRRGARAGLPLCQRVIIWRSWATIANCWCSRWRNCRKWRGAKGVRLQSYKDGGLADIACTMTLAAGPVAGKIPAGRTRT
jgi:topoisomerase IV subunit A